MATVCSNAKGKQYERALNAHTAAKPGMRVLAVVPACGVGGGSQRCNTHALQPSTIKAGLVALTTTDNTTEIKDTSEPM